MASSSSLYSNSSSSSSSSSSNSSSSSSSSSTAEVKENLHKHKNNEHSLPEPLNLMRKSAICNVIPSSISNSVTFITTILALTQDLHDNNATLEYVLGVSYFASLAMDIYKTWLKLIQLKEERIAANDRIRAKRYELVLVKEVSDSINKNTFQIQITNDFINIVKESKGDPEPVVDAITKGNIDVLRYSIHTSSGEKITGAISNHQIFDLVEEVDYKNFLAALIQILKFNIRLISLNDDEEPKRKLLLDAKKNKTPLLIQIASEISIYSDPKGDGNWDSTEIESKNIDLRQLGNGLLNYTDERFMQPLIEILKKNHNPFLKNLMSFSLYILKIIVNDKNDIDVPNLNCRQSYGIAAWPSAFGIAIGTIFGGVGFSELPGDITKKVLQGSGAAVSRLFVSTDGEKVDKEIEELKKLPSEKEREIELKKNCCSKCVIM